MQSKSETQPEAGKQPLPAPKDTKAHAATRNDQLTDKLAASPIAEEIDEEISYDEDFEVDDKKEETKAAVTQKKSDLEAVRDFEKRRAQNGNNFMEEEVDNSDRTAKLNALWERVRECLLAQDANAGTREPTEGPLKRFEEFCSDKQKKYKDQDTIKLDDILGAFAAIRLSPMLTITEFTDLFTALEVFQDKEAGTIVWNEILQALHNRSATSFRGIFPKIRPREPTKMEIEDKRKREEEAIREKEKEQKELELKIAEEKKRIAAWEQKNANIAAKTKTKVREMGKEEAKRLEKEKLGLAELMKTQQTQRDKEELEQCKKEAAEFTEVLTRVRNKFEQAGGELSLMSTFKTYDTDNDGLLTSQEFLSALTRMKIFVKKDDIDAIYKMIDEEKRDNISYREITDVLYGRKQLDSVNLIKQQRIKDGRATGVTLEELKATEKVSAQPTAETTAVSGPFSDLTSLMRRSDQDKREKTKFVDDSEHDKNQQEIKEAFLQKAYGFEDLCSTMGVVKPGNEGKISFEDFNKAVSFYCKDRFSSYQIKFVFQQNATYPPGVEKSEVEKAHIPITKFKDEFYPQTMTFEPEYKQAIDQMKIMREDKAAADADGTTDVVTESLAVSQIMGGLTREDIDAANMQKDKKRIIEEQKQLMLAKQQAINDEYEKAESDYSVAIDRAINARSRDPKDMKDGQDQGKHTKKKEVVRSERSEHENQDYYRQKETQFTTKQQYGQKDFDLAVSNLMEETAEALAADLNIGGTTRGKKKEPEIKPETYVDRYGKEFPGFITFNEFKDIFMTHVYFADEVVQKKPPPPESKLRALFAAIDTQNRARIGRDDFASFVKNKRPSGNFLEKLRNKVMKGKDRFTSAISLELNQADKIFGSHGVLPLPVFQTIMVDYGLPLMETDKPALLKEGIFTLDKDKQFIVHYKLLLRMLVPQKNKYASSEVLGAVLKVQKVFRGYIDRKRCKILRESRLKELGEEVKNVGSKKLDPSKAKKASEDKEKAEAQKKKLLKNTKEEMAKKKEAQLQQQRLGRRAGQNVETKMAGVVKAQRDARNDRLIKQRAEIESFIKDHIIQSMINKAHAYGESLQVCRDIQKNFANRPVTKYIYPLLLQFQFNVAGVQPKSLQAMNSLGQIMFLNNSNQLQQYDIATTKSLQSVNLGTKPPLKHYDIIDMVCDQRSGRIYTLNANWILEIWNIEQNTSFPQKRIAVCSNEGGKDYIGLYYRQTFQNSKPRFLSLQESNQQILVVNTSCVDGSIVFIDPISFSVLKKIQLRYQDYEIPKAIKQAIIHLKEVLQQVQEKTGRDTASIFTEIVDPIKQSIEIKKFVSIITKQDQSFDQNLLYKTCWVLDRDNSGAISLDDFISLNEQVAQEAQEESQAKADQELQDAIWPEWVIKEGKMEQAQTLLARMHRQLELKFSEISAEQVFSLYDAREKGFISKDQFQRIIKIFFEGVLDERKGDIDFLLRLTVMTTDQKIQYRDFCKFLNKRLIRSFKHVVRDEGEEEAEEEASKKKSALEIELERPIRKEASLNYILKKAAQLQIDLRKEFIRKDPLELSVLSRVQFWNIIISQPLGLNEDELNEIFDNDLNFDNYGNVDYTSIINSDIFVKLEARRIQEKALKTQKRKEKAVRIEEDDLEKEMKAADNRKVVVEDLIFIEDLELIIYSTVAPKTSTVFITSLKKATKSHSKDETPHIEVAQIGHVSTDELQQQTAQSILKKAQKQETMTNRYQLIAKLKGHKNAEPPTICFVPQTGCLISGEKHIVGDHFKTQAGATQSGLDPSVPPTTQGIKENNSTYDKYSQRHRNFNQKCEIFVWNLQRDMIELFSINPPWFIPAHHKFVAHDDSIIDICYLSKAQLLVTSSVDQTIRFWDPISVSYQLTDPSNNPHALMKPGYYTPLKKETTKSNVTFKEVKRIYTGQDTSCYALRQMIIQDISLNSQCPEIKSQIEWLVALKMPKITAFEKQNGGKSLQMGFICGYGIERVKIEVPALHHDDIVPPYVLKECEDMISLRRKQLVTAFQTMLPFKIEKVYSQVQLQNSYMEKIRALFMQAILNRKDGKYVNPVPLREIYNIIVKLPTRTKFESFLASTGCADKLSVSETFFYLQKFMQIHPLRTTQIEFEKSIEDFYQRHQRQFLRGIKRWPKAQIQKFANYIRTHGLNVGFLQEPSDSQTNTEQAKVLLKFCTRERFTHYFMTEVKEKGVEFAQQEIEVILNELDPFYTGVIQISSIQRYYSEEISYFKTVSLNRPSEVIEQIRSSAFPTKKIALQQALAAADAQGDGFIDQEQFIAAFYLAKVNIPRENLEFLFDVMSEIFVRGSPEETASTEPLTKAQIMAKQQAEKRFLNLDFFYRKLFQRNERREVTEVDETLSLIKASLIYKGVDFSIIFAEYTEDTDQKKGGKSKVKAKKAQDEKVDMMCHYTRFAQQLMKNEFCERLGQLKATNVTEDRIRRLANYLSLNQKNQSIIYLNSWLHHLRRVQTAFNIPDRNVLPIICAKLLNNEVIFRSWVDTICQFKQKREEDKFIEQADLRQVLKKFGVHYINQNLFLNEFTRGPVHIDDLITLMKRCISSMYASGESEMKSGFGFSSLDAIKNTDFFARISKKIQKHAQNIDKYALLEKFREFDSADTGLIKASFLVQVLNHNLPHVFDQSDLIGLQFELECLSYDHQADYSEFVDIFFKAQDGPEGPATQADELKLQLKKTSYTLQDYEDLLSRISAHVKKDDLPIENVFKIYWKQSGFITYENLRQILTILEFPITEKEFDILILYADENNQQSIHGHELVQQIMNAEQVAPQFDMFKWIQAAREVDGKVTLLEQLQLVLPQLNEQIEMDQATEIVTRNDDQATKQAPKAKTISKVITGDYFQSLLRREIPTMSEPSIELVTRFAIKGSKRMAVKSEKVNSFAIDLETDLIQFKHLEMALMDVIQDLKKEEIKRMQKDQEALINLDDAEMLRREFDKKERDRIAREKRELDPQRQKRESQLVSKITDIFRQREISFYDAFQEIYDPLKSENIISISKFKELIKTLNLPLTVQDHRILRRMADPKAIGQVNINLICERFDTIDLRKLRLNKVLDQVATAFFIQNFNMKKAFQLFDQNGDGLISRRELREAFNTLKLGLKYSEIDDIIGMMSTRKDGLISYDDFIHKMDANIRHRHDQIQNNIEEALYKKVNDCLTYSGESLRDALASADYDETGSILKEDLTRVFKRIGLSTIEPNLPMIMEIGGVTPNQEKIDIDSFSTKFMKALNNKINSLEFEKKMFIHKVHSLIKAKQFSLFDVFVRMDVNQNGSLTKIELKTGMQALGIVITNQEMQTLWKSIKKCEADEEKPAQKKTQWRNESLDDKNREKEGSIRYIDFINTFVAAGCVKFDKSTDHSDVLLTKYRMQLQRQNLDVEKAYRAYDSKDVRFVFRHDFIDISMALQLEFSEDEFSKIFDIICSTKAKKDDTADIAQRDGDKRAKSTLTRFTYQQFKEAITVKQDENWIFQAFIKIQSVVLQKSLTYKRLFTQWKDSKKSKAAAGRLTSAELAAGLKKLNAGLTNAEISRIVESLPYDGKDLAIGFKEFEDKIKTGSQKLEHEQSFERMLLVDWIMQFNDMMDRNDYPFDKLFREHDSAQAGGLSFQDFIRLNEFVGVSMAKKDLHRVYEIIDKDRDGLVNMDEIKNIANLTWKQTEEEEDPDSWLDEQDALKGNDILVRQQLLDVYDDVKTKLENKNATLEQIFFNELQFSPHALATVKGLSTAMDKLGIVVSQVQAERMLKDLRKVQNGKFECTYKDFVDYMTRRRINVAFLEKGFIDPLLASCTQALVSVKELYNFDYKALFKVLAGSTKLRMSVSKDDFVTCVQGMELKLSVDDISEFFNHCDTQNMNRITQDQFVTAIQFIQSRIGGVSSLELQMTKGASVAKKGQTNASQALSVVKKICDGINTKKLSIRQLAMAMDINGTGFVSRPEFVATCQQLNEYITLDEIRMLAAFLDDKNAGKISINEFLRVCTETLNSQIGGGMSAFMQVQPIIEKIINELSIDCDRFFDEIADANQKFIEHQQQERDRMRQKQAKSISGVESTVKITSKMAESDQNSNIGLSKSVFFKYLTQYGVILKEHEKALISTVFGMMEHDRDKLDYNLIDNAFEGIQQNLYARESQFTDEWQRRVYRKIGHHLMQNNKSIAQCFDFLDMSGTQTIQIPALKSALIRFQLNLSDKELDVFTSRIDTQKKGYVSKKEFISKFWAAYTYEEVFLEEDEADKGNKAGQKIEVPQTNVNLSHNIVEASKKLRSELEDKVKLVKMFSSIQRKIKLSMSVESAFMKLDTLKTGYLSLRDFHINFSNFFDLSLREDEIRTLFQEIDSDQNGILLYEEFENFYKKDYRQVLKQLELEREQKNTQNEIFDHLIKVLQQRGLTLQDVFEEIDVDQNNFIDVEEFHNLLERMGFTITQTQVNDLMSRLDENFDGRISYDELRKHIEKLGFDIGALENDDGHKFDCEHEEFVWRDKAVELIIRTFHNKIGKKMSFGQYFGKYDEDHDAHLSPPEFRKALMDLKEPQLKPNQIERIMHILLEEKKLLPLISLERIAKFFTNYKYLDINDGGNSNSVLIDEDLFCYIVEKYDGISRMMELSQAANDKSNYISRHIYEINSRGLNMMSNQKTVQILGKKANTLSNLYNSTMVLLAGEVNRLIKEEAQMCVLDPTHNIDTIVSDQNIGVLTSVSLPTIENSSYDIDQSTAQQLPCGAQQFYGKLVTTRESVEILLYPADILQYVSLDGKSYKAHLAMELQVHRYIMGARFEEEDEFTPEEQERMDIVMNIGKFEKKIGLSMNEKEVYVINKKIDEDNWINLEDFVHSNGGILNIPLFYHTDAPLFIIRHWAKMILQIIAKVHDVSIVLRCLNTKQIWISRDGQRIKLGHTRGVGRVNNLGFIIACPDIYLNLDNNEDRQFERQSSQFSPSRGQASSSRKTEGQRKFSNAALDDAFVAPEMLFNKFQDHTAAIDVWAFGMIMYCVLFGKRPASYYKVYREWFKKSHNADVEIQNLPFIPPSQRNFIYDPFSIDFEMPFDKVDFEELVGKRAKQSDDTDLSFGSSDNYQDLNGDFNFENFMKCIKNLSYSSMFANGNSKKFMFRNLGDVDSCKEQLASMSHNEPPRFPGQQNKASDIRRKALNSLAQATVLARKNELGLILDLVSSCLDVDPKKRPTIQGLLHSPIFKMDSHEQTNAVRFSQNVILYRSPQSSVSLRITDPLRVICEQAIQNPMSLYDRQEIILKLFSYTEDCINHISSMPIDEINQVLTENEKRKGILESTLINQFRDKNYSQLRVSPNSPLASQVIEDKVIDMLIFVTLRYLKNFKQWKNKKLREIEVLTQTLQNFDNTSATKSNPSKSVGFEGDDKLQDSVDMGRLKVNRQELLKKQTERLQNHVIGRMSHLLKLMVYEMHSYSTPLAPYVEDVIRYIVKFFLGEEADFGSDVVLRKTSGAETGLQEYLRSRSFFRRENELNERFESDRCDKLWHLEQKNLQFLDKSNYWCLELHKEALKIFKDAITESGMGQSCYPVINDYIQNVSNSFEPTKIFSKQMNQLSLSFLIPMHRTAAYYNELIPLTESLSRLYDENLEKAGKRCSLAMIRSVFQTGNSDKIKACLDLRIPKHIIHFLQDSDAEIRKECLLILLEISKGLQDEDFEIMSKNAVNMKQEFSKYGFSRTAFDKHKAMSMAAQQEVLDPGKIEIGTQGARRGKQAKQKETEESQTDQMCNFIKRTIALIEKNENERYINFALDLPNLNFLSSKRFLKEMAICFESPVFIAPLIRLLKNPDGVELHSNKMIILELIQNLICGNERVLIAINSPACDTYMTLLKMLMQSTKMQNARQDVSSQNAKMRYQIQLQDKAVGLFKFVFEQQRPTIIRDIKCIGAASTLLKEQRMTIPDLVNLPELMEFFDTESQRSTIIAKAIDIDLYVGQVQQLRCWIKHFYKQSAIPELTRIKALQRCMNFLIRVTKVAVKEFFEQAITSDSPTRKQTESEPSERKDYKLLIRTNLSLFDWVCVQKKMNLLFNEECGRTNIDFVINTCNLILSQFRKPIGSDNKMPTMEDLTFNDKQNRKVQNKRKYEIFPLTDIGSILQNIQYQLVRANDPFINQLLSEANFGFVFGEQLLLEFDFVRHCIDNCVESMVLIDSYVKKNEIRLNTFEYLLRSHEHTLKDQFIKSNFCERLFLEYIGDFREFNIQFSKIDLEFLAFRRSFPLRLEAISILNTALMLKPNAPQIYTEMLMYARRHFLVRREMNLIQHGGMTNREATSLLLFAIIVESNEEDLIYVMVQEGVHRHIRNLMKDYPSLNKRFPVLAQFINRF